ncbi:hypothetical protein XH83_29475 [Bradyrhizobium sp. CCBAU 53351]|uniref:hypothetical protein n=1 Tax=Bradyrhizobium sp. CCBAU 53351 TaxID=1325114 RepID=UPI0018894F61|nr:hypothetical protein [Bradyrhizobium sp. CCBAU 53351]QOZ79169.1 hypothetical protein XH83_29475 [Bradyrhizobium sp. CCBAU 53351]
MPVLLQHAEQPPRWAERRPAQSKVRSAQLEHLARPVLTVLSMGSVLTALIALRAAIYLWQLHA